MAIKNDLQFQMRVSAEFLRKVDDWRRVQLDLPPRAEAIRRLVNHALTVGTKPAPKNEKDRAAGDAYAHRAAGEQIDRSLKGLGHSDHTKAERKSRLLKRPGNAKPKI